MEQFIERLSEASLERRRKACEKRRRFFLAGPIPVHWLAAAGQLRGKALAVGLALWFQSGLRHGQSKVSLGSAALSHFKINYQAARRGLAALESTGLVTVERHPGRRPIVTINVNGKQQ
jgi:hypothetical protein